MRIYTDTHCKSMTPKPVPPRSGAYEDVRGGAHEDVRGYVHLRGRYDGETLALPVGSPRPAQVYDRRGDMPAR